jgi:ketosteroid isomerase-like protein
MRTVFASIAFFLSLSLGTSAQDSNAQIKAAVRDVLVRQQDAWNRHDLEAFMSGYWNSPDLTFFSGANVTTGWQDTLDGKTPHGLFTLLFRKFPDGWKIVHDHTSAE